MIQRPQYLNQLIQLQHQDVIKVITGVRRSGKSVLLMLYRDYLLTQGVAAENIIYYNFESFELLQIRTAAQLQALLAEKLNPKAFQYVMLDEIQMVTGWQAVVNGVRTSFDCEVLITGSNAKLLSGELATLLSGRYVEIQVQPFSFSEYLATQHIAPDSPAIYQAFADYEKFGGFPAVVLANDAVKDTMLSGIYDSIILNDVALRTQIRDTEILKAVVSYLADNIGQLVNPTKIANTLKSVGFKTSPHTIAAYLEALENAFLFYRARQYDIRGRAYLRTAGKYYIADSGLRRIGVDRKQGNYAGQLENIIYLELVRRGFQVDVGKLMAKEIDFVARKADQTLYVQASYELPDNTHETDNLLQIPDNYQKIMLVQRYYPDLQAIDGIPILNVADWLLASEKHN